MSLRPIHAFSVLSKTRPSFSPALRPLDPARRRQRSHFHGLATRLAAPLPGSPSVLPRASAEVALPAGQATIPDPTPLVPDMATLLRVIGRDMDKYAKKIKTWEALFTLSSGDFAELGVKPPRNRRYLLSWLHRFRLRQFGPAGDFQYVQRGKARLCVWTDYIRDQRRVVNVPFGADPLTMPESELCFPRDYWVSGTSSIKGPLALKDKRLRPDEAVVSVRAHMWEHKRGVKVDGGERRRKSVRFKRLATERKLQREERLGKQH